MAISKEQIEFAKEHYETLIKDLMAFPEKHELVDKEAIKKGEFDLLTTVQATFDAYHILRANTYDPVYVRAKFQKAIELIYTQGYLNLDIEQETRTSERMRAELYQKEPLQTPISLS